MDAGDVRPAGRRADGHADWVGEPHTGVEQHFKVFRDMMLGFIRVHVLHYANLAPVYGSGLSAKLDEHGYHMSSGTLYPLLHNLTAEGFLARNDRLVDSKIRKYYSITPLGRRALDEARRKVVELVAEISVDDTDRVGRLATDAEYGRADDR